MIAYNSEKLSKIQRRYDVLRADKIDLNTKMTQTRQALRESKAQQEKLREGRQPEDPRSFDPRLDADVLKLTAELVDIQAKYDVVAAQIVPVECLLSNLRGFLSKKGVHLQ